MTLNRRNWLKITKALEKDNLEQKVASCFQSVYSLVLKENTDDLAGTSTCLRRLVVGGYGESQQTHLQTHHIPSWYWCFIVIFIYPCHLFLDWPSGRPPPSSRSLSLSEASRHPNILLIISSKYMVSKDRKAKWQKIHTFLLFSF